MDEQQKFGIMSDKYLTSNCTSTVTSTNY